MHGASLKMRNARGFPQGGVASAKFWPLAFDPAIKIINTRFVEGNGYADDLAIVFGGSDPNKVVDRLQCIIDRLVDWGKTCGLMFNPKKTEAIYFSRARTLPLCKPLFVDGQHVPFSDTARYLGVYLDRKLYWTHHVQIRLAKAKRYLMLSLIHI